MDPRDDGPRFSDLPVAEQRRLAGQVLEELAEATGKADVPPEPPAQGAWRWLRAFRPGVLAWLLAVVLVPAALTMAYSYTPPDAPGGSVGPPPDEKAEPGTTTAVAKPEGTQNSTGSPSPRPSATPSSSSSPTGVPIGLLASPSQLRVEQASKPVPVDHDALAAPVLLAAGLLGLVLAASGLAWLAEAALRARLRRRAEALAAGGEDEPVPVLGGA